MRCRNIAARVELIPNPYGRDGFAKRMLQLRSLVSTRSFERLRVTVPAMQQALDRVLRTTRFDVVNLEFTFLGDCDLRQAPPGERPPALIVDSHNIDYDLARQYAKAGGSTVRRLYAAANWRKLRREELGTYRDADGVYLCSTADEQRLLAEVPSARTVVIPNAGRCRLLSAAPHRPHTGRPYGGVLWTSLVPAQCRWRDPLRAGDLAAHCARASASTVQDHRRLAATFAHGIGRAADRIHRLRSGSAAASCRGRGRGGAAADRRRHASQDRRGHGDGKGHRLHITRRRGDRGGPRARSSDRGPAGIVRGRGEPSAGRARIGGTDRDRRRGSLPNGAMRGALRLRFWKASTAKFSSAESPTAGN